MYQLESLLLKKTNKVFLLLPLKCRAAATALHTEFKTTMLAQGRDYVQLKTRSAVLESDCLDFLFEGFQVQGCCCGLW